MTTSRLLLVLFIPLLNFHFSESQSAKCESSWSKFEDNCYFFGTLPQGRVSYYDAEDYCRSRGAHLASIHSEEENKFVLDGIRNGYYGGRRWIGLNVLNGEGKFQWSDDTTVDYEKRVAKSWYQKEKCYIIYTAEGGWRSEHCAQHNLPLCKRPLSAVTPTPIPPVTTPTPSKGNCPRDWIQHEEKCYKYFGSNEADRVDYKQAKKSCSALGTNADLVSIHSMEEQAFLTQNLQDLGVSAWIGMTLVTSDEIGHDLVFGWTDNSRTVFTNWVVGHPPPGTWKYCARLNFDGVGKGAWIADYCEIDKKGYICQQPSDPKLPEQPTQSTKCSDGATKYRDSCYRFESTPKDFNSAEETCKSSGGHLVSVDDGFEQSFLHNFIGQNYDAVWSGLKSVGNTKLLHWSNGNPLYYSNWASGQPLINTQDGSCNFLDKSNNLKWNLTDCTNKLPFVCETSKATSVPRPAIVGTCSNSPSIDIGDEYCYHVAESKYHVMGWGDVSRYCLKKGMRMLVLKSDHQANSLGSYLWKESRNIWLGLVRSFDKESYLWIDNTPMNYTNWAEDEPRFFGGDKECVSIIPGNSRWQPAGCNDWGVTICQDKKVLRK